MTVTVRRPPSTRPRDDSFPSSSRGAEAYSVLQPVISQWAGRRKQRWTAN